MICICKRVPDYVFAEDGLAVAEFVFTDPKCPEHGTPIPPAPKDEEEDEDDDDGVICC